MRFQEELNNCEGGGQGHGNCAVDGFNSCRILILKLKEYCANGEKFSASRFRNFFCCFAFFLFIYSDKYFIYPFLYESKLLLFLL